VSAYSNPYSNRRNRALLGAGLAGTGNTRLVLVGLVAVELVAQPPERVPGHLVRYLGVDLHRERYAAVAQYRHDDARVHVERG
jgi:hypothetical protein